MIVFAKRTLCTPLWLINLLETPGVQCGIMRRNQIQTRYQLLHWYNESESSCDEREELRGGFCLVSASIVLGAGIMQHLSPYFRT